ncbi:MAG: hypothetical protein ACPHIB_10840, partial [Thalassobaculaceae bacterium]
LAGGSNPSRGAKPHSHFPTKLLFLNINIDVDCCVTNTVTQFVPNQNNQKRIADCSKNRF